MAATLNTIRTKVRRLTRSPEESNITTAQIDDYINTFVLYDFPEELRLFALRTTLTFYTEPYVDVYESNDTAGDPLENFKNKYITVHEPLYIAGYPSFFSQSRTEFFAIYPLANSIQTTGFSGDGATTSFNGTLSAVPVLRSNVTFSTLDGSNGGLELHDDGSGTLTGDGTGTINYVTGAYVLNFSTAPGSGQIIYSETRPYAAGRPKSMLYFDNKFTLRPVPDKPYPIQFEVYKRPTELLLSGDEPELEQWWQYIAYGAAKKIYEDRTDMDGVQQILPEFKHQERLVLRRTIVQQTKERTATIYTYQSGIGGAWQWWGDHF